MRQREVVCDRKASDHQSKTVIKSSHVGPAAAAPAEH
jgi:hypothetical protein